MAMAGGISSSYAAYCLKRDTHEVVGITFLFYACKQEDERLASAKKTCEQLEIEHHIIDARDLFKEQVINPVCKNLNAGMQPDPLSFQFFNKLLFSRLFEHAPKLDCQKIATGHFAGITSEQNLYKGSLPYQLKAAADAFHDESYYLYGLSQDELSKIVFPLADIAKPVLRREAMRAGLVQLAPLLKRYDPFFLQGTDLPTWAKDAGYLECKPGPIVSVGAKMQTIGTHCGLAFYKIGQQFNGGLSANKNGEHPADTDDGRPIISADENSAAEKLSAELLYVIAKDVSSNTLYVGSKTLAQKESCQLCDVTWTSIEPIKQKRSCKVKLEFLQKAVPAQLVPQKNNESKNSRVVVVFNEPILEVPLGSDCVFYSDSLVLGGGRII